MSGWILTGVHKYLIDAFQRANRLSTTRMELEENLCSMKFVEKPPPGITLKDVDHVGGLMTRRGEDSSPKANPKRPQKRTVGRAQRMVVMTSTIQRTVIHIRRVTAQKKEARSVTTVTDTATFPEIVSNYVPPSQNTWEKPKDARHGISLARLRGYRCTGWTIITMVTLYIGVVALQVKAMIDCGSAWNLILHLLAQEFFVKNNGEPSSNLTTVDGLLLTVY